MEIIELQDHPYYVATQFHPEYLSRPLKPSPPFLGLVLASIGKLDAYLKEGNKLSSSGHATSESSSDDDALFSTNRLLKKMNVSGKPIKQKEPSPDLNGQCNGTHTAECNGKHDEK